MKVKADISIIVEINNDIIIDYCDMNTEWDEKPTITNNSSFEEINNYYSQNENDIIEYVKDQATTSLLDICDEVCIRGHEEFINVEIIND